MNRPSNYCGHCGNRTQTMWLQTTRPAVGIRPKLEREKGFEPSTASLEGWNSTNWATPAGCDELGTFVTFFYMEEVIKPTNTMGSFYQATFLLNASVFIAQNWINGLTSCGLVFKCLPLPFLSWTLLLTLPYWRLDSNQRFKLTATGIDGISIHWYVSILVAGEGFEPPT